MNSVLKSDSADTNVAVAKIICLDLGWHLEFRRSDEDDDDAMSGNFLLVIPALRYADSIIANHNNDRQ